MRTVFQGDAAMTAENACIALESPYLMRIGHGFSAKIVLIAKAMSYSLGLSVLSSNTISS